jgi:hypothetical protein
VLSVVGAQRRPTGRLTAGIEPLGLLDQPLGVATLDPISAMTVRPRS